MSIVSEIKKLVRENGGTPSGNTTAALLDDFLGVSGGGSSSGGGDIVFANISPSSTTEGTCDLSPSEIRDLLMGGKTVYYKFYGWTLTEECHTTNTTDVLILEGGGFAVHPLDSSLCYVHITHTKSATGNVSLAFTLTPYASAPASS